LKNIDQPSLVVGGVKFVSFLSSGCIRLRRLKNINQPNLVEGGIKLVPVQKAEKVEKYWLTKPGEGWH
jgi:hypothetical protein